ncbi:MAG: ferrochelatase [Francisellaceae bacterium]|nr:ferrochelatase [Francisellaceae bacterium]
METKALRTGVLLINLGSPKDPEPKYVRAYLKEFLNDKRVIDIPYALRKLLLNFFILPFRPKQSSKAYKTIWNSETTPGSPLIQLSIKLKEKLQTELGNSYLVNLGMNYGEPNLSSALKILEENYCDKIIILPLYPQYSSAATGSALEKVFNLLKSRINIPQLRIHNQFYNHPDFINAWQTHIQECLMPYHSLENFHYLFSYHGLPLRQIIKSEPNFIKQCNRDKECPGIGAENQYCYRAQCFETTRLLSNALKLAPEQYSLGFQSRLGVTPWIKPYTDKLLIELVNKGIRNLIIACPSFVSDCLETLEEIAIRAKAQWQALGGENFIFIPCLNTHPLWIKALSKIIIGNQ